MRPIIIISLVLTACGQTEVVTHDTVTTGQEITTNTGSASTWTTTGGTTTDTGTTSTGTTTSGTTTGTGSTTTGTTTGGTTTTLPANCGFTIPGGRRADLDGDGIDELLTVQTNTRPEFDMLSNNSVINQGDTAQNITGIFSNSGCGDLRLHSMTIMVTGVDNGVVDPSWINLIPQDDTFVQVSALNGTTFTDAGFVSYMFGSNEILYTWNVSDGSMQIQDILGTNVEDYTFTWEGSAQAPVGAEFEFGLYNLVWEDVSTGEMVDWYFQSWNYFAGGRPSTLVQ